MRLSMFWSCGAFMWYSLIRVGIHLLQCVVDTGVVPCASLGCAVQDNLVAYQSCNL